LEKINNDETMISEKEIIIVLLMALILSVILGIVGMGIRWLVWEVGGKIRKLIYKIKNK